MCEQLELSPAIVIVCCAVERSGKQREGALCTQRWICYGVRPGFGSSESGQPSIIPFNAAFFPIREWWMALWHTIYPMLNVKCLHV